MNKLRIRELNRAPEAMTEYARGEVELGGHAVLWLSEGTVAITAFSGIPDPELDRQVAEWGINQFSGLLIGMVSAQIHLVEEIIPQEN